MNHLYFTLAFFGFSQLFSLNDKTNDFQLENFQKKELITAKDSLPEFCAQAAVYEKWLSENPAYLQKQNLQEAEQKARIKNGQTTARRGTAYEIPVVVHIIHNNGPENISDARVEQGIQFLNEAYANSGAYAGTGGLDTELSFRLATIDPDNMPTNGINRVVSTLTDLNTNSDFVMKSLSRWEPTCYVNIYIVGSICAPGIGCGVAGYAFFPTSHGDEVDGVVLEAGYMGTDRDDAVVLAHELGHYLGLYHTFQDGCKNDDCLSDGDRVCDTPPDQSTVRVDCADGANSCNTDVNPSDGNNPFLTDQNDQMENFMDYSSCSVLFTEGQKARMVDVIENIRFSLIDPDGCAAICDNPVTASFTVSSNIIDAGETVTFTNTSNGAVTSIWTIDGVPFTGNQFTFNEVGTFRVELQIIGTKPSCEDFFSTNITVLCPVKPNFATSATQVGLNEIINFTNQSTSAVDYEWSVDGSVLSTNTDFDFSSPDPNIYNICLTAKNTLCEATKCLKVLVNGSGNNGGNTGDENCTNGIDDDGDGLVDFFDDDCPCLTTRSCGTPFYTPCIEDCNEGTTSNNYDFDINRTDAEVYKFTRLASADIDGDCEADFCAVQREPGTFNGSIEVSGQNGFKFRYFERGTWFYDMTTADVDNDGAAEIFVTAQVPGQNSPVNIYRLDYNLATNRLQKTWTSSQPIDVEGEQSAFNKYVPLIADFNSDGIPEVYTGNQIFDSETGQFLAFPGAGFNMGAARNSLNERIGAFYTSAIAVDMLPDNACANCEGLELVAGNQVFSVNLTSRSDASANTIAVEVELPSLSDGLTAVADYDLDGDLDVIVSTLGGNGSFEGRLFIWDGQSPSQMGQSVGYNSNGNTISSIPAVGDLDGDGRPEIVINVRELISFEDYQTGGQANWGANRNQTILGSLQLQDHPVGVILFDFDFDGRQEAVLRNNDGLFILDERMTIIGFEPLISNSSNSETPLIVDADNDQQAEIVTTSCESGPGTNCTHKITIINSAGFDWSNTRKIQNQSSYFNTNINDDGTVPLQQQNPHLVNDPALNSFNQQYAMPAPIGAEASAEMVDAACGINGIDMEFEICNEGEETLPASTPVAIYGGNPTQINALLRLTFELPDDLFPGECIFLKKTIAAGQDSVFVVVNDDGTLVRPFDLDSQFPPTSLEECNYLNNISGFEVPLVGGNLLDLGPDQTVCDNGVFPLDAGDFKTYRWFDGTIERTLTAFEPGTYWVEVTDACGNVQSDTIVIEIDPITEVKLGADLTVCIGDTVRFDAGIFDDYKWLPKLGVDCDTCQVFELEILQDTQIVVTVASDLGCFSVDTVNISIGGVSAIELDSISICRGDTILVNGTRVFSDTLLSRRINSLTGCDSLFNTRIIVNDSIFVQEKIEICAGDSISVFGNMITKNDTLIQVFNRINGCDSTLRVEIEVKPRLFESDVLQFCEGDTAMIFGNMITENDTVSQVFTSTIGCDSTSEIRVVFVNSINTSEVLSDICAGDTVMVFGNAITRDSILFETYNSINGCDSTHEVRVNFRPAISGSEILSFCEGDTARVFGFELTNSGTILETFTAADGCDSTATIEIVFNEISNSNEVLEFCEGDTARVLGLEFLVNATVSETLQNFNGCDSIHTIDLVFNPRIQILDSLQFCVGDTAFLFGNTFTSDTILSTILTAAVGCDSIQNLKISFFEAIETNEVLTFCEGDTVSFLGLEIFRDTTVSQIIQSVTGCDSTHTIDVFFNQRVETFEQLEYCTGDTVFLFGNVVTDDGAVSQVFTSAIGCDSTHNIDVVFLAEAEKMVFDSLCTGDILLFFNDTISETGTYFQTVPSLGNSCDTNYVLTAEFFDAPVVTLIADTVISIGEVFEIPLNITDPTLQVTWLPNESLSCEDCSNPTVILREATTFEATITNKRGCSVIARINIRVVDDNGIYIPNTFSPNDDGINDFFTAFAKTGFDIDQLQIFDRWGGLLFELNGFVGNDASIGWDGIARGMPVGQGVYVYKFLISNSFGEQEMLAGDVTVLR